MAINLAASPKALQQLKTPHSPTMSKGRGSLGSTATYLGELNKYLVQLRLGLVDPNI